jgi:hypothetical protein
MLGGEHFERVEGALDPEQITRGRGAQQLEAGGRTEIVRLVAILQLQQFGAAHASARRFDVALVEVEQHPHTPGRDPHRSILFEQLGPLFRRRDRHRRLDQGEGVVYSVANTIVLQVIEAGAVRRRDPIEDSAVQRLALHPAPADPGPARFDQLDDHLQSGR